MTTLSKLLATTQTHGADLVLEVPPDWMQGRSVFGGLQVAFALQAMRALVPDATLRTLQTTFIAPVAGHMRVQARILRTGKNTTHVEARIGGENSTDALVIGVFGAPRSSIVARTLAPRALETQGASTITLPFGGLAGSAGSGDVPHFTKHFQVHWQLGHPPFAGKPSHQQVLEIAIDDEGPATEAHLLAIADFIPPIGLSWLATPAPGSTLTWMLELLTDRVDHLPLAGFRVEAELVAARDGYTSQAVRIFAPSGEPLALSHQQMLVFG